MNHQFRGVARDKNTLDCVGTCSCGFTTQPDNDKEVAWERIIEHSFEHVFNNLFRAGD